MLKKESVQELTILDNKLKPVRPEPIISNVDVVLYKRHMHPQTAIDALIEGCYVLIIDFYGSGLTILNELKKNLKKRYPDQSFKGQREFRSAFRKLSHQLVLEVSNARLSVKKAPVIGWFKILYPELSEFLLPFPQVQGLNSSWQWYEKGILIPVLGRKIHPWYGTYFPTRFEHLELFDSWLKGYRGGKKSAIDIGIGSGVLSFQMLKHGFKKIIGTDSNPNAIIGLNEYLNKNNLHSKIGLIQGDLFAKCDLKTELIVFNPPWLPANYNTEGLDRAIYYDNEMFARFFTEAKYHLEANGKLVILFSNLSQVTNSDTTHPVIEELKSEGRFQKVLYMEKNVRQASKRTKRNQNWRSSEKVELWVLKMAETSQG